MPQAVLASHEYAWNFTSVDSDGDAGGFCSIAISPEDSRPAISYTEMNSDNLRFAWYNGSVWNVNRHIADDALQNTLAFNSSGIPSVAYYSDNSSKKIMYITSYDKKWDLTESWNISCIEESAQNTYPGLVFNCSDIPLVSYRDAGGDLCLSLQKDKFWHHQKVVASECLEYTSVAINPVTGWPAIAYTYNNAGEKLFYSFYTGISWSIPAFVHNQDGYGLGCSLAFNSSGYPGISYIKESSGELWYAYYNGVQWNKICVDDSVGSYSSVPDTKLAYNKSGCPGISYYDGRGGVNGDLKFAFCNMQDISVWQKEKVYSEGDSGIYSSFEFDQNTDLPLVAFYRKDCGDLYFGKKGIVPKADFKYSISPGDHNITVSFSDTTISQSDQKHLIWSFGDNTSYEGPNPPVHEYADSGTYQVSLNFSDIFGVSAAHKNITICPHSCFEAVVSSGKAPLKVNFTDFSQGNPMVWNWSFGDKTHFNTTDPLQKNASHTYMKAGLYNVSLAVSRGALSNTTTHQGMISVGINASFTTDITSGEAPLTVILNDTSAGYPDTWEWDFDDGSLSHEKYVQHTFQSAGVYNVSLNASSDSASDKYYLAITVSTNSSSTGQSTPDLSGSSGSHESAKNLKISACSAYGIKNKDCVTFRIKNGAARTITVVFKENTPKALFTIECLKSNEIPVEKPKSPVYEYEHIRIYHAPESSVMTSSLLFEVDRGWLKKYGFSKNDVSFLIFDKTTKNWTKLPVFSEQCDNRSCSYTARIPKFSYYAISADKSPEEMPQNSVRINSGREIPSVEIPAEKLQNISNKPDETDFSKKNLPASFISAPLALLLSFVHKIHAKKNR